ncbi:MAG: methionine--tRNA ligase subunit beta [Candidatus Odinarchaeia archaeon]
MSREGYVIISYDEFKKIKLKVGQILKAEPIKGSKKLLKLSVDLGENTARTLVAGLAEFYSPQELLNKKVIVVSNMKPAKIFGVESHGMLLAAVDNENVSLVTVTGDIKVGSEVE